MIEVIEVIEVGTKVQDLIEIEVIEVILGSAVLTKTTTGAQDLVVETVIGAVVEIVIT